MELGGDNSPVLEEIVLRDLYLKGEEKGFIIASLLK